MKRLKLVILLTLACLTFNNVYADNEPVVLYEQSFENGIEGWLINNQYGHYDSDQKCLVVTGNGNLESHDYLGPIVFFGTQFYRDVKLVITMSDNAPIENVHLVANLANNSYKMSADENNYQYNEITHEGTMSLPSLHKYLRLGIYINGENVFTYPIQRVKVTGIPVYDAANPNPDNVITQFSDIYTLPLNSLVRINAAKVTSLTQSIWKDDYASIFVDYKNSIHTSDIEENKTFNATIYGITAIDDGVIGLQGVKVEVGECQDAAMNDLTPISISENDYSNYLGQFVEMPLSSNIIINENGVESTISPIESTMFRVCGIVMPKNDKRRLLCAGATYNPSYLLFTDNNYISITSDCIGLKGVVRRPFEQNKWYSLILPFNINSSYGTLAVFNSSDNGILNFSTTTSVSAGHPFLFKPNRDISMISSDVNSVINSINYETGSEFNFVGTFNLAHPSDGSYYLAEGATIKPLSSGGTIKGLRAYFEPNIPGKASTRSIELNIDGQTTAISDVVWGNSENENNAIYDLKGQYVGNDMEALRKGVYIINGKKYMK